MRLLIDHNASLESRNQKDGHTAVFEAALKYQSRTFNLLIDAGADVNAKDLLVSFLLSIHVVLFHLKDNQIHNWKTCLTQVQSWPKCITVSGFEETRNKRKTGSATRRYDPSDLECEDLGRGS